MGPFPGEAQLRSGEHNVPTRWSHPDLSGACKLIPAVYPLKLKDKSYRASEKQDGLWRHWEFQVTDTVGCRQSQSVLTVTQSVQCDRAGSKPSTLEKLNSGFLEITVDGWAKQRPRVIQGDR